MRFAGSTISFAPTGLKSAGGSSGAAAAAGINDVSEGFAAARQSAVKPGEIANAAMIANSQLNQQRLASEADVRAAGLNALTNLKGAKIAGEYQLKSTEKSLRDELPKAGIEGFAKIASAALPFAIMSDETTKTNIEQIDSALEKLRNLKPVSFYYKEEYGDPSCKHHGFIAQEYKQVLPDATYEDEATGKLCIDPIDVIALLVRANQELEARITRLEVKSVLEAV